MAINRRAGGEPIKLKVPAGFSKIAGIRNVTSGFNMAGSELGDVFDQVQSAYGSEVIQVLSNRKRDQPRIRTGIFVLDLALAGGWLTSRGSMLYGERSAGKSTVAMMTAVRAQQQYPDMAVAWIDVEGCVAEDTRILDTTTSRVFTAREVFENRIAVRPLSFNQVNEQLEPATISSFFDNGLKTVVRIYTGNDYISVTENHKMLVWSMNKFSWLRADQLEEGMHLCRPMRPINRAPVDNVINSENARLVGYLLGDGGIGTSATTPVFTNIDQDAIAEVAYLCRKHAVSLEKFSDRHYRLSSSGSKWHRNSVTMLLERLGIKGTTSNNKFIPSDVFTAHQELECLAGLYMTDGTVHTSRPTLSFCTSSYEMAQQVRYAWSLHGIVARIYEYDDNDPNHAVWYQVNINGNVNLAKANSLLKLVGVKASKLAKWANHTPDTRKPRIGELYPNYSNKTYRQRDQYKNTTGVYFEEIILLETEQNVQTYDFSVPGNQNFVANDFVVHNTFDHTWFVKMGGDPSRLILVEPESGEHAVDMADAMARSKETSLLVTDSIAMLVPMKEIASSAEDNLMGVHARLTGNYLRRINSALLKERHRQHRLLVLHINQFRMKIGVMFGDPRTLPGGKALEFCTSQQVEIKNKEILFESGAKEGQVKHNEHSFKITKDKTGGKLRSGKFLMVRDSDEYGGLPEGTIHQAASILQLGEAVGLVQGKEIIGFGKAAGRDAWMAKFLDDPQMYVTVMDNIIEAYIKRWGLTPSV